MKLIIIVSAILLVTTSASAYSDECAKGPEYWCRDASTAGDCGAIRHCEQTVWLQKRNNIKAMTTNEDTQIFCNVLVRASTELLIDGSMDIKSIEQYLRHDCTRLSDHNNLIRQCEMAVDLYLADILRHIESGTKATQICPTLQRHDFQMVKHENVSLKSLECLLCKFVISYIDNTVQNNRTPAAIEEALKKVCNVVPAVLKENCTELVQKYGPIIAILLATNATPVQVCDFIKFCKNGTEEITSADKNHIFSTQELLIKSTKCSLCKYVDSYIVSVIQNNKSEAAIKLALERVCGIVSGSFKDKCDQFVQTYRSIIVQHFGKYGTPEPICHALKLCDKDTQEITAN